MEAPRAEITQLLQQWSLGQQDALDRLLATIYAELRRLAVAYLRRERRDHTLQATVLVHEAFLKLVDQREEHWQNRAHFFGIAAQMMRRILIDHARAHGASKSGSDATVELLALDDALARLEKVDPQQGRVVELRFFGGLTIKETAEVIGISTATVERDWILAKAWLYADLGRATP